MKKNAVLIAGILFTAGCATHQGGYSSAGYNTGYSSSTQLTDVRGDTIRNSETIDRGAYGQPVSPNNISTAGQYDPANVGPFHADSSIRGGSNEARGLRGYGMTETQPSAEPLDSGYEADSSIRGGSRAARDPDYRADADTESSYISSSTRSPMKADSSIRGGSNEARGGREFLSSSSSQSSAYPDHYPNYGSPDDLNVDGFGTSPSSEKESSSLASGSAQINPYHTTGVLEKSDHSVSSSVNTSMRDDMNAGQSVAEAERNSLGDLNSSQNLEKHLEGEIDLNKSDSQATALTDNKAWREPGSDTNPGGMKDPNAKDAFDSSFNSSRSTDIAHTHSSSSEPSAVGVAAATEVGASSSSSVPTGISGEKGVPSQVGLTSDTRSPLFENNRAQGVGTAATGEYGVAQSGNTASNSGTDLSRSSGTMMSNDQLAEKVKADLVKTSTGTVGINRDQARNIKVSANNGTVTLKGSVPSEKDKKLVEIRVREIQNVKKVDNQLTVSSDANPASRDLDNGRNLEDRTDSLQR